MAIPTAYLSVAKNVKPIFADIQRAGVPQRFTYDFLKQLGHASSANRPVIAVLKALRFLDDNNAPTERYRRFKDPAQSGAVLAEAMREAYSDVFTIDQKAHSLSTTDLQGIFARLSDKGEAVNRKMATTFKTLAELATWDGAAGPPSEGPGSGADEEAEQPETVERPETPLPERHQGAIVVHHDVHIHLPVSTEIAVYDAIFRSLRENLR